MTERVEEQTQELVQLLRQRHVAAFVDRAASLPAADVRDALLQLIPAERAAIRSALPPGLAVLLPGTGASHAEGITDLAALLSIAVVVCDVDSIAFATESVRRQAIAIGDLSDVLVVDTENRLAGMLTLRQLLLAPIDMRVRDVMLPVPVRLRQHEPAVAAARALVRYQLAAVAVVDERGHLLGRVVIDAVRDLIGDGPVKEFLRFAGVSPREAGNVTWRVSVKSRLPRLYLSLLTAFSAAAVVYFFRGALARNLAIAVWMPVVAGVGGNAGTQALATMVRRLRRDGSAQLLIYRVVAREAWVGLINGTAIGAVVAAIAVLLGESWRIGLVVLIAMAGNIIVAGVAAASLPSWLRRAGRDPERASAVVLTAIADAAGLALLLGAASWLLL